VTGEVTADQIPYNPDGDPARWAQWWLIFYTDAFVFPLGEDQSNDIKAIPIEWNAAHAIGHLVVLPTGAEFWNSPPRRRGTAVACNLGCHGWAGLHRSFMR
jgi:hypothetical protein